MRARVGLLAIVLAGLAPLEPTSASAGDDALPCGSNACGFEIGLQLLTNVIGAEDPSPENDAGQLFLDEVGRGVALTLGYALTPQVALRFSLGAARHETTQRMVEAYHSAFAIEAHYRFLPHERARPYVLGGVGGSTIALSAGAFEAEMSGAAANFGIGMLYDLTQHLIADAGVRLDLINWSTVKVTHELPGGATLELEDPVDASGSAGKFLIGILWRF